MPRQLRTKHRPYSSVFIVLLLGTLASVSVACSTTGRAGVPVGVVVVSRAGPSGASQKVVLAGHSLADVKGLAWAIGMQPDERNCASGGTFSPTASMSAACWATLATAPASDDVLIGAAYDYCSPSQPSAALDADGLTITIQHGTCGGNRQTPMSLLAVPRAQLPPIILPIRVMNEGLQVPNEAQTWLDLSPTSPRTSDPAEVVAQQLRGLIRAAVSDEVRRYPTASATVAAVGIGGLPGKRCVAAAQSGSWPYFVLLSLGGQGNRHVSYQGTDASDWSFCG